MHAAKERLRAAFTAAPYRPTGLATADQALSSLVQLLEWGASQVSDAFDGHIDLTDGLPGRTATLLRAAAGLFADTRALLTGRAADPDYRGPRGGPGRLRRARCATCPAGAGEPDARLAAAQAVHAQAIAVVARGRRRRRADREPPRRPGDDRGRAPQVVRPARRAARVAPGEASGGAGTVAAGPVPPSRTYAAFSPAVLALRCQARPAQGDVAGDGGTRRPVRSGSSTRCAARSPSRPRSPSRTLSGVQHGFWVVLGTLSVLRTSAASTGATAWRALAGTVVGFVDRRGAAARDRHRAGRAVGRCCRSRCSSPPTRREPRRSSSGQAAFTVTIVVLFNLLAPAGWRVGLLRIEDVAIGCAVSLVVGVLFWPRGVASVVGDDLADAFRRGAAYLTQAVDWALSELLVPPAAAVAAANASIRLDDAVRGFLTEQGSKRLAKEDLWALVNASTRLRLTAHTLAGLRTAVPAPGLPPAGACLPLDGSDEYGETPACVALRSEAGSLAGFYDQVATEVGRSSLAGRPWPGLSGPPGLAGWPGLPGPRDRSGEPPLIPPPPLIGPAVPRALAAAKAPPTAGGTAPAAGSGGSAGTARGATVADGPAPAGTTTAVDAAAPAPSPVHPHLLWVQEHLHHLSQSAQTVSAPAQRVAEARRRPWWR